jgi:hypothetical protein
MVNDWDLTDRLVIVMNSVASILPLMGNGTFARRFQSQADFWSEVTSECVKETGYQLTKTIFRIIGWEVQRRLARACGQWGSIYVAGLQLHFTILGS